MLALLSSLLALVAGQLFILLLLTIWAVGKLANFLVELFSHFILGITYTFVALAFLLRHILLPLTCLTAWLLIHALTLLHAHLYAPLHAHLTLSAPERAHRAYTLAAIAADRAALAADIAAHGGAPPGRQRGPLLPPQPVQDIALPARPFPLACVDGIPPAPPATPIVDFDAFGFPDPRVPVVPRRMAFASDEAWVAGYMELRRRNRYGAGGVYGARSGALWRGRY